VAPGVFFERNILPELRRQNRTIGELATLLGVSRQTVHQVIAGEQAISPDMAVRLGKLCGNGADYGSYAGALRRMKGVEAARSAAQKDPNP
jgi:addiction module HigA family antidote